MNNSPRLAIVVSRFNSFITDNLLNGSLECLKHHGCSEETIDIYHVPGAFEIALTAQKVVALKKHDAIICLGAVIRGETPHFDYVAGETARGIAQVSLASGIPVIFGVLTTDTVDQAIARSGKNNDNKGWDAAQAALEMVTLLKSLT